MIIVIICCSAMQLINGLTMAVHARRGMALSHHYLTLINGVTYAQVVLSI